MADWNTVTEVVVVVRGLQLSETKWGEISLPKICPCCGSDALSVERGKIQCYGAVGRILSLDTPICIECLAHAKMYSSRSLFNTKAIFKSVAMMKPTCSAAGLGISCVRGRSTPDGLKIAFHFARYDYAVAFCAANPDLVENSNLNVSLNVDKAGMGLLHPSYNKYRKH